MPFVFKTTPVADLMIIEPQVFADKRGFFLESYKKKEFEENGIFDEFVQDNHSVSTKGVLRGLHFQRSPFAQAKLVRVVEGAVWDVGVDLRPDSKDFMKWFGLELSAENKKMLYLPEGFAHGFLVLSDRAQFIYKCSNVYAPKHDGGVRWDDPEINIDWPKCETIVSEKDEKLPFFRELEGLI